MASSSSETTSAATKSVMEAASSSLPSTAGSTTAAATKSAEGLADTLSGMSYDNILQATETPSKLSESLQQSRLNTQSFDAIKNVPSFDTTNVPSFDAIKNTKIFSDVQG